MKRLGKLFMLSAALILSIAIFAGCTTTVTEKVYVENISPEIESVSFRPSDWGAVGEAVEITLNASDPAGDRDLLSYLCKVYRNVNGSWVYDRRESIWIRSWVFVLSCGVLGI